MKVEKSLKIILIILLIVLISLISFVGIFVQKGNRVNNILPEFKLGTDLTGSRHISIQPSKEKEKVIYDENGQVVEEEGEKTTTEEVAVNPEEVLTKENYEKSKQIIIERLEKITEGLEEIQKINQVLITKKVVDDFIIKVDEANGGIFYQIPENEYTDLLVQILSLKGEFNVVNEEGEELLSHSDLKEALIGYGTTETGTTVYLSLELTEDGANKLKEISKTYVHSTDEEGNETGTVETKGAVYLAKNMYSSSNSVTSTLVYGCQWDAMCRYIGDPQRTTPTKSALQLTGSVSTDVSKNIYDLAGNCRERTMEARGAYRVYRGGFFSGSNPYPVWMRSVYQGTKYASTEIAFRTTLYIK